jgi:Sec1-binding region of Mso1
MSSYFSSLLTTTTSRVATLRANLLTSEQDGDTQDDTHLCRVLRSYYTEKGRQFPAWLPPDPKLPPPVVIQPALYTPGVGSSYGNLNQASGGTALSSLWDSQPQSGSASASSASLAPSSRGASASPGPRPTSAVRQNPFARQQQQGRSNSPQSQVQSRPLPSQREGSYQSISRAGEQPPGSPASGSGQYTSAKDRLRKLARPKVETPRGSDTSQQSAQSGQSGRSNGYPSSAAPTGNYEDRFAPPEGGYAGVRSRVSDKPFVAATSPWATTESEFGGGGYDHYAGSQSSNSASRPGLPSNPAASRRGAGSSNTSNGQRRW